MNRKTLLSTVVCVLCMLGFVQHVSAETPRRASFDSDWKFNLGEAAGADKADFADSAWRKLDLPHDWMIEGPMGKDPTKMDGPFDEKSPGGGGNGYLDGGVGWYRKTFTIPAADKGKHIAIDFDGVYMNSEVWINGTSLGKHPYGYTSFEYDLTPNLKYGDEKNVIAVRAEVVQPCSRFYSGAGIYRNVWLVTTNAVHVDHWGTYVTTEKSGDSSANVVVHAMVVNDGADPAQFTIQARVIGTDGKDAGQGIGNSDLTVTPGKPETWDGKILVSAPKPWSIDEPNLYRLETNIIVAGKIVDHYATPFGIRTIEFTNDDGFHLNGKRVQIQGVCDHHDLGCLGAAINKRAIQRQLEVLRSFGVNAIRTSHYPPAPELLDLADEMGFVVMDEAFDEWKHSKTKFGYGQFFDEWSERDIVSMVHRDRNHPSIVMWSIGNEINEQGAKNGGEMATRLADIVKREDPTRPTVSAMSNPGGALKSGFSGPLGVFGVNYNIGFYNNPGVHDKKPMIGSETSSALSSRGEYELELDKSGNVVINKKPTNHQVTDYDVINPGWGNTAHVGLEAMKTHPWMAGEFVWTGFDYIGEPTPYGWPSRSSYFGIVDLAGFPKDRYYLYKSQWTPEPMVHVLPSWNWDQFAGKEIPVWAYTNADSVELFLNDKSQGEKTWANDKKDLHLEWSVPYAPGTLKAVAKKDGKIVATDEVHTSGKPAKILLKADRSEIKSADRDMSFITVSVVDADGNICPQAEDEIKFTIEGPGTIAGVDNGDAINHESFQGHQHKVFHGLGLVVIAAGHDAGAVKLSAAGEGLASADVTVSVK